MGNKVKEKKKRREDVSHFCISLTLHNHQGIYVMHTLPISSLSLLMKETLFFTDRSSLLWMDSSREKSKSNLQKRESRAVKSLFSSLKIWLSHLFVLPFIEFWIEVSLLGGGSSLGGCLLVRQQDEGNIGVGAILGAGCQGSVGAQRSQTQRVVVQSAPSRKCKD